MSFFKNNITWIAPTAAILLVSGVAMQREGGLASLISGQPAEPEVAQPVTAPVTASQAIVGQNGIAALNASVEAALDPEASVVPAAQAQRIAATIERVQRENEAVTRSAPVDLLEVAPAPEPQEAPETQVAAFDAGNAASFFEVAQEKLALDGSCKDDLYELAAAAKVYFPTGALSAEEAGLSVARLIGMVARDCPGFVVVVEGHSDPSGNPAANLKLSEQRAQAVISRLAASGIDTSSFVAKGYGDTRPSGVTGTESAAYYDRRVEFSIQQRAAEPKVVQASLATATQKWPAEPAACVTDLRIKAEQARQFYEPRAITASVQNMDSVIALADEVRNCEGAWLRIVGHHSDQPGSRENVTTGRMRALAMMSTLVASGVGQERLLIGAPSVSVDIPGQPTLPNSRIDFQVISD
ncbi:MAG: OmpA family protein [Sulfitobacter sp.]